MEKLQHIQRLEFHSFADLDRMLRLEHDLRMIRGSQATEGVVSIGRLLKGVKTIRVTPPFRPSLTRTRSESEYDLWNEKPGKMMLQAFPKLTEIWIVSQGGVKRLEVPGRT